LRVRIKREFLDTLLCRPYGAGGLFWMAFYKDFAPTELGQGHLCPSVRIRG